MDVRQKKEDEHEDDYSWRPRRFVYAFELATKLSQIHRVLSLYGRITHFSKRNQSPSRGCDTFTSMKALSAKIVQECTRVTFNTGHPTNPFQKLLLSDFDFIQHTPGPELCYMASTHEDGDGNGDGDDDDNDDYIRERLQPDPERDNSTPLDDTDQLLYMDFERIQLRSRHYNGY